MELQLMNLRKAAGYKSRKAFGDALGVAERQIKSWESLETRLVLEDACKIADFLHCSLDELAGRWDYVGKFADSRQRRMNEAYSRLDDDNKDAAVGAVLGMASVQATKKSGEEGPEAREGAA